MVGCLIVWIRVVWEIMCRASLWNRMVGSCFEPGQRLLEIIFSTFLDAYINNMACVI